MTGKKLPDDYGYAIDELINSDDSIDKAKYYKGFIDAIIDLHSIRIINVLICLKYQVNNKYIICR